MRIHSSPAVEKAALRREILNALASVDRERVRRRVRELPDRLAENDAYRRSQRVLVYLPMAEELPLLELWQSVIGSGRRLYLPAIAGRELIFREWGDADPASLVPGAFGIPVPAEECEPWDGRPVPPSLAIVPGLGFTENGGRLGRGGGYYDRFLLQYKWLPTLGICLREQIRENLPLESHDVGLDGVIIC
jgi:5-formyltetrahydrofolate cyclo-ligase